MLLFTLSSAAVCFPATDLCKQYAVDKEYDKAVEECTKQINGEIAVKYLEYSYSNRGAAYANRKQYDEAISDYTKAIELNPDDSAAYHNRAMVYARRKEFAKAVSDRDKAVELSVHASSPATPASPPVTNQARKTTYYVQLGAFKNKDNAAALTKRFKRKGYGVFMMNIPAKNNGTLYRVLIGRFEDKHKSEKLAAKIRKKEKMTPTIFSE